MRGEGVREGGDRQRCRRGGGGDAAAGSEHARLGGGETMESWRGEERAAPGAGGASGGELENLRLHTGSIRFLPGSRRRRSS
uniref:Uncharacterized protein n=1 Tax=Hordeum vulgare subsp. vulgare TaxID=112509 RepID=A0A8I6WWN6_HORVV